MAYNNGREDRKWRIWKEAEEKVLREHGVDEATIEQIRIDDRADFNSNRRFYHWTSDFGEYLEGMADREQSAEVKSRKRRGLRANIWVRRLTDIYAILMIIPDGLWTRKRRRLSAGYFSSVCRETECQPLPLFCGRKRCLPRQPTKRQRASAWRGFRKIRIVGSRQP